MRPNADLAPPYSKSGATREDSENPNARLRAAAGAAINGSSAAAGAAVDSASELHVPLRLCHRYHGEG